MTNRRKRTYISNKKPRKRDNPNEKGHSPDMNLFWTIVALSIFGAIMIYSGSVLVAVKQGKSPYHFFLNQIIWITLGSIGGFIAYKFNYKHLPKAVIPAIFFVFLSLILVLVLNINQPIKRWIPIGPFTFQPSEMVKLVFPVYLSGWLAKRKPFKGELKESIQEHFYKDLLPFLFMLSLVSIPILIQPDLDTTIIIAATSFIVYFVAGTDIIHFFSSVVLTVIFAITGFILTQVASYRLDRVTNWFKLWQTNDIYDPFGSGYQLRQILVAVASGGLFGVGFGESSQKFHYLGETAFTDTIFAIFAEEFGLIGSIILIFVFVYIFFRGIKIARTAQDKFGAYIALSITIWLTLQAFMHIASNVALIPINGNTLPFMSYGGSSTLVNLTAIGLLLNISRFTKETNSTLSRRR